MWDTMLFYTLLGVAFLLSMAALVTLFKCWRKPTVIEYRTEHGWWSRSPVEKAPAEEVIRTFRSRRILLATATAVLIVSVGIWSWALLSGELSRYNEAERAARLDSRQQDVDTLVAASAKMFAAPLSEETATEFFDGIGFVVGYPAIKLPVVFPDGSEDTVDFSYRSQKPYLHPATDEIAEMLNERGWKPDAELQRSWLLTKAIAPELEQTYGVVLQPSQRTELAFPGAAPTALTRYGSTPMTTNVGDGTYFNGIVTLIWDGEFKLIGSEGTDRAAELARP